MTRTLAAGLAGVVFGVGLSVSQMANPAKVLAFLDLAGAWDPSLALVMGGASIWRGTATSRRWSAVGAIDSIVYSRCSPSACTCGPAIR